MAENYIVSARKYRPQTWESVVGQKSITSTLQNAINNNRIAQAYLFCGPRGVGKTTCARIFAKEVNRGELEEGQDQSFTVFELDAASNNGVDDIRTLTDQVRIPPQIGKYKLYIIDEVHMLSQSAFNAFLKTLEEPPPHAIFILATTEKHKIIPTILSRCQIFDFNRIKINDTVEHLEYIAEQEGVSVDHEGLHVIAQKADGAMRDALSIFDQIVAFSGKEITYDNVIANLNVLNYENYFKIVDFMVEENISGSLLLFNQILDKGFDGHHFINGLGAHLRNVLVAKDEATVGLMEVSEGLAERYKNQASRVDLRLLVKAIERCNECDINFRTSKNQHLLVELCLMQLCSISWNEAEKKNSDLRIKPFDPAAMSMGNVSPTVTPAQSTEIATSNEGSAAPASAPSQRASIPDPPPAIEVETHPASNHEIAASNEGRAPASAPTPAPPSEIAASNKGNTPPLVEEEATSQPEGNGRTFQAKKKLKTTGVSLSNLFDDTGVELETEGEEDLSNMPQETFSAEDFASAWKEFAQRKLDADQRSLYATLTTNMPTCEDGAILLKLTNSVQEMEIDNLRGELMEFLRNKLNNGGLSLKTVLIKDDSTKLKFYTDKDKFDAMKEENPSLDYFRKRLNLDLDF